MIEITKAFQEINPHTLKPVIEMNIEFDLETYVDLVTKNSSESGTMTIIKDMVACKLFDKIDSIRNKK